MAPTRTRGPYKLPRLRKQALATRLDPAVIARLRAYAARQRWPMAPMIEQALTAWLDQYEALEQRAAMHAARRATKAPTKTTSAPTKKTR